MHRITLKPRSGAVAFAAVIALAGAAGTAAAAPITPASHGAGTPPMLYVANASGNALSVVNTATGKLVGSDSINDRNGVGSSPRQAEISPDGTRLYVLGTAPGNIFNNVLTTISTSTHQVIGQVTVAPNANALVFDLNPSGSRAYVLGGKDVFVVDTAAEKLIATIPEANLPNAAEFSPDGSHVYVSNNSGTALTVINASTNTVSGSLAACPAKHQQTTVTIAKGGKSLYVMCLSLNLNSVLDVVNTATGALTKSIRLPADSDSVVISPDGSRLFTYSSDIQNSLDYGEVVSTASNTIIGNLSRGFNQGPTYLSFSPDGSELYAVSQAGSIQDLNPKTGAIKATIPLAAGASASVVTVTADGKHVLAPVGNAMSVFDTATDSLTATKPLPIGAGVWIVVNPKGTGAYLLDDYSVSVIDDSTFGIVATVPSMLLKPRLVALSPGGTTAYVGDLAGDRIGVVDLASGRLTQTMILPGEPPEAMAVSPDGHWLYELNLYGTVEIIDLTTDEVTKTLTVGANPIDLVFSPDGTHAYVTNSDGGTISVIDTTSQTVTSTVTASTNTTGSIEQIAISPDGTKAYVTEPDFKLLDVVDLTTGQATAHIPLTTGPDAIVLTPNGQFAYLADDTLGLTPGTVTEVNLSTDTVVTDIKANSDASALAITPDGSKLYVSDASTNAVTTISTATNTVTGTIPVSKRALGSDTGGMAIAPGTP